MAQQQAQHLTPGVPTGSGDGSSALRHVHDHTVDCMDARVIGEGDVRSVSVRASPSQSRPRVGPRRCPRRRRAPPEPSHLGVSQPPGRAEVRHPGGRGRPGRGTPRTRAASACSCSSAGSGTSDRASTRGRDRAPAVGPSRTSTGNAPPAVPRAAARRRRAGHHRGDRHVRTVAGRAVARERFRPAASRASHARSSRSDASSGSSSRLWLTAGRLSGALDGAVPRGRQLHGGVAGGAGLGLGQRAVGGAEAQRERQGLLAAGTWSPV